MKCKKSITQKKRDWYCYTTITHDVSTSELTLAKLSEKNDPHQGIREITQAWCRHK